MNGYGLHECFTVKVMMTNVLIQGGVLNDTVLINSHVDVHCIIIYFTGDIHGSRL